MATGKVLWTYGNGGAGNSTNSGFEVPGPYPTFIEAIGNGIIYLSPPSTPSRHQSTKVHSPEQSTQPTAKNSGQSLHLQANSQLKAMQSQTDTHTFFNSYDQQIYSLGRGPSQTTVQAGPKSSTLGGAVIIEGTVTDISAGTNQNEQAARFPNGVPVSSDASMKDWMGYIYQQQACPTNFTGVEVTLNVVDANGNYRTIGTTTTDASGYYSYAWSPDISGKYTVSATFAGSNGYWPSYQETAFTVLDAPATATPLPTPAPSMADLYFIPAIAGLFIAIIVVGLLIALMVRKRP